MTYGSDWGNFVMTDTKLVSEEKNQIVKNLYLSGIGEEFIALQLDLEIPTVIEILKELNAHKEWYGIDKKEILLIVFLSHTYPAAILAIRFPAKAV